MDIWQIIPAISAVIVGCALAIQWFYDKRVRKQLPEKTCQEYLAPELEKVLAEIRRHNRWAEQTGMNQANREDKVYDKLIDLIANLERRLNKIDDALTIVIRNGRARR